MSRQSAQRRSPVHAAALATSARCSEHDTLVCVRAIETPHGRDEAEGLSRQKIPVTTNCLKLFYRDREFFVATEIVWPRVATELWCRDKVWAGIG